MANRKLGVSLLLTTALAGTGYGVFQDSKVKQLENQVQLLNTRLGSVEKYVQAQARSLKAFGASLDFAVKKGYTAGINFESRKVLVRGWREIVDAAAKHPPTPVVTPVATPIATPPVDGKPVYGRRKR